MRSMVPGALAERYNAWRERRPCRASQDGIHDTSEQNRAENNRGYASRFEDGKLPKLLRIKCHAPSLAAAERRHWSGSCGHRRASDPSRTSGEVPPATLLPSQPLEGSHRQRPENSSHSPTTSAQRHPERPSRAFQQYGCQEEASSNSVTRWSIILNALALGRWGFGLTG